MIDWENTLLLIYAFSVFVAYICVYFDDDITWHNRGDFIINIGLPLIPIFNIYIIGLFIQEQFTDVGIPKPLNELIKLVLKNGDYTIDTMSVMNKPLNLRIGVKTISLDHRDYETPRSLSRQVRKIIDNKTYSDKLEIYERSKQNV